jgi:transposase-like protein
MTTDSRSSCPECGQELWHGHDAAYGMIGTHMAGSERYECHNCNKTWYKKEGEKIGLKFFLD